MNAWEFMAGNPFTTVVLCIAVCSIIDSLCGVARRKWLSVDTEEE